MCGSVQDSCVYSCSFRNFIRKHPSRVSMFYPSQNTFCVLSACLFSLLGKSWASLPINLVGSWHHYCILILSQDTGAQLEESMIRKLSLFGKSFTSLWGCSFFKYLTADWCFTKLAWVKSSISHPHKPLRLFVAILNNSTNQFINIPLILRTGARTLKQK
jgi:hypothetical protein